MSRRGRGLEWDFAGSHGTAWGAFNLCATVVTVTTLEGVVIGAPWYVAAVTTCAGFMAVLGWAALRRKNSPPATVLYQLVCWAGAGVWSAWMLARVEEWTLRGWATACLILGAGALAAGILFALGREEGEESTGAALAAEVDPSSASRIQLEDWYEAMIDRFGGARAGHLVSDIAVKHWENGAGYSVEGKFTGGSWGMSNLAQITGALALELDLPAGCDVTPRDVRGEGRRRWVLDVGTKNELAKGMPYPVDAVKEAWSINGPIPIGVKPSGEWQTVELRQRNLAVAGMPGEGKTVGLKSVLSGLVLAADCIPWGTDLTGGDLVNHFDYAFTSGKIERRPIPMIARTVEEAEAAARAALRIGYARKEAYGHLYRESGASLLPIGTVVRNARGEERILCQIEWVMDETTTTLRAVAPENVALRSLLLKIVQELRGAGVRIVVPPLSGDNQYIGQDFQKMIHTVSCGRMESPGEYKWTLGSQYNVDDSFYAEPGYAMMRPTPGAKLEPFRYFGDMTPAVIESVCVKADQLGSICDLDWISEDAANGIRPDGSPWPNGMEMISSDRGWWNRRWDSEVSAVALPVRRAVEAVEAPSESDIGDLLARAAEAEVGVCDRRAEAEVELDFSDLEELDREGGWRPEWLPEIPAGSTWRERVWGALRDAGSAGLTTAEILATAQADRSDVSKYLSAEMKSGRLERTKRGHYRVIADEA